MAEVLLINPRKRRKRRTRARSRRRVRRNPIAGNPIRRKRRRSSGSRRVRRFRANPVGGMFSRNLMPTLTGAGGALLTDAVLGYLPLPAALAGAGARPFVRAGLAFGLGWAAGEVTNKTTGRLVTLGALTVVTYDWIKGLVQSSFPDLQLGDVRAMPSLPFRNGDGMGAVFPDTGIGNLVDEGTVSAVFPDTGVGELIDESSVF